MVHMYVQQDATQKIKALSFLPMVWEVQNTSVLCDLCGSLV